MNKYIIPFVSAALLSLCACDDKDIYSPEGRGTPVAPGTELHFGTSADSRFSSSRTAYGVETEDNIAIHWTFAPNDTAKLDKIFIFCPEAEAGKRNASFRVDPESSTSTAAPAVKIHEDKFIASGSTEYHNFYGFYPLGAIYMSKHDDATAKVSALMPMNQYSTFKGTTADDEGKILIAEPDMQNCHMQAYNRVIPVEEKDVDLLFKAIPTVFDITLSGPAENENCTVASLVIRCNTGGVIAGGYEYSFADSSVRPAGISGLGSEEPASEIEVILQSGEGDNVQAGVEIEAGKKLNVKAFAIPDSKVKNITIEVYSTDGRFWSKTLDTGNNGELLEPGKIHKVQLGVLADEYSHEDRSSWMEKLPGTIPVTLMSIPGSGESFTYLSEKTKHKHQTATLTEQFDAGIRAFRCHILLTQGNDDKVDTGLGYKIVVTSDGTEELLDLGEAVHMIHQEMQGRSNNEFAALVLSDCYDANGRDDTHKDYETLFTVLKETLAKLVEAKICPDNLTATTTLGEVRGKVMIYFAINGENGLCDNYFENDEDNPIWNSNWDTYFPKVNNHNTLQGGCFAGWYRVESWLSQYDLYMNNYAVNKSWPHWYETKGWILGWSLGTQRKYYIPGTGLERWKPLEGSMCLISWWTRASFVDPMLYPLTFGQLGEYTIKFPYNDMSPSAEEVNTNGTMGPYEQDFDGLAIKGNANGTYKHEDGSDFLTMVSPGLASWNARVTVNNMVKITNKGFEKDANYMGLSVENDDKNGVYTKAVVSHNNVDWDLLSNKGYEEIWPDGLQTKQTVWCFYAETSPLIENVSLSLHHVDQMWGTNAQASRLYKQSTGNILFATYLTPTPDGQTVSGYTCNSPVSAACPVMEKFVSTSLMQHDNQSGAYKLNPSVDYPLGLVFMSTVPAPLEREGDWGNTSSEEYKLKSLNRNVIQALIDNNNNWDTRFQFKPKTN